MLQVSMFCMRKFWYWYNNWYTDIIGVQSKRPQVKTASSPPVKTALSSPVKTAPLILEFATVKNCFVTTFKSVRYKHEPIKYKSQT